MPVRIEVGALKQYNSFRYYNNSSRELIIQVKGRYFVVTSVYGKKGACLPIEDVELSDLVLVNSLRDNQEIEIPFIWELLTVEEMLTHPSEEVRLYGLCRKDNEED